MLSGWLVSDWPTQQLVLREICSALVAKVVWKLGLMALDYLHQVQWMGEEQPARLSSKPKLLRYVLRLRYLTVLLLRISVIYPLSNQLLEDQKQTRREKKRDCGSCSMSQSFCYILSQVAPGAQNQRRRE